MTIKCRLPSATSVDGLWVAQQLISLDVSSVDGVVMATGFLGIVFAGVVVDLVDGRDGVDGIQVDGKGLGMESRRSDPGH